MRSGIRGARQRGQHQRQDGTGLPSAEKAAEMRAMRDGTREKNHFNKRIRKKYK